MNQVPVLWTAAYGRRGNVFTRLTARWAVRSLAFVRALALAERDTFMTL